MIPSPPDPSDVLDAARRLSTHAVRTPLLSHPALDARLNARVLLKPEVLQRTGSFKFRGAFNRLSRLDADARARGVVAFSSGNHAQGVALAARLLDMAATIVMPDDAPRLKIENTKAHGARVILYDRATQDREAIARALAAESGATVVPSYDDPDVIAGQGTIGLEVARDAKALGLDLDTLLTPCSGGGLAAGIALGLEAAGARCAVRTVEPQGFDDYARSLAAGRRLSNPAASGSICDALLTTTPGVLTFAVNASRLGPGLAVSDAEAMAAVAYAFETLKLVVEPGGAVALAAALSGALDLAGQTVVIVLSGGNVDAATFARCLGAASQ